MNCNCGNCPDDGHLAELEERLNTLSAAAQALADLRGAVVDVLIFDPQMGSEIVMKHFEPAPKENN